MGHHLVCICMHDSIYLIYIYSYIYVYIVMLYICNYKCVYIYICMYTYIYIYCIYIYTCIHTYIYIYILILNPQSTFPSVMSLVHVFTGLCQGDDQTRLWIFGDHHFSTHDERPFDLSFRRCWVQFKRHMVQGKRMEKEQLENMGVTLNREFFLKMMIGQ